MNQFNPGDRVRVLGTSGERLTDQLGTVRAITPILNILLVQMDRPELNSGYGTMPIGANHLEKIEEVTT